MESKTAHRIYIAGAMTPTGSGNHAIEYLKNVRAGIRVSTDLMLIGFSVYCPMIDFQYFLNLRDWENLSELNVRECGMSFVEHWAEVLYVLPGWEKSTGVHDEVKTACLHNIPVFYSIRDLLTYFEGVDRERRGEA
jgi:hypothetical protein